MKMYHKDSKGSIDVHPSQIENMKRVGWTTEKTPKPKEVKKHGND